MLTLQLQSLCPQVQAAAGQVVLVSNDRAETRLPRRPAKKYGGRSQRHFRHLSVLSRAQSKKQSSWDLMFQRADLVHSCGAMSSYLTRNYRARCRGVQIFRVAGRSARKQYPKSFHGVAHTWRRVPESNIRLPTSKNSRRSADPRGCPPILCAPEEYFISCPA